MSTLSTTDLLTQLHWRYAVKKFDASKKIPEKTWSDLEEATILSPTSYGLQHWKMLVTTDATLKKNLRGVSWNQSQVEDCSHFVVFLNKQTMAKTDVDRLIKRTCDLRGTPPESMNFYRGMMMSDFVNGPRSNIIPAWTAKQAYIALGNLMTSAAVVGIDACPMEGIEPAKYDAALGLENSDYRTVVACALGYRSADDKYAHAKKVRFEPGDMILRR